MIEDVRAIQKNPSVVDALNKAKELIEYTTEHTIIPAIYGVGKFLLANTKGGRSHNHTYCSLPRSPNTSQKNIVREHIRNVALHFGFVVDIIHIEEPPYYVDVWQFVLRTVAFVEITDEVCSECGCFMYMDLATNKVVCHNPHRNIGESSRYKGIRFSPIVEDYEKIISVDKPFESFSWDKDSRSPTFSEHRPPSYYEPEYSEEAARLAKEMLKNPSTFDIRLLDKKLIPFIIKKDE